MLQEWRNLGSVHWPYDPAEVQRLLPKGLLVDTCNGAAWVGLIPFEMCNIRVPHLPALGRLSTFPETNVRTYVLTPEGCRAVWFFSLDISRLLPAIVARTTYGLPYCWSSSTSTHDGIDTFTYTTARRWPRPQVNSRLELRVGAAVAQADLTELERFLTARWALASRFAGMNLWADVAHAPWELHHSQILDCEDSLVTAAGLTPPAGDPLALWSPGVKVRIGRPRRLSNLFYGIDEVSTVRSSRPTNNRDS